MFLIPGFIISLLTFPGVIIHEAAHHLFCRIRKVPMFDVCYFSIKGSASGYVQHAKIDSFSTTFLVSIGPFIVNTLLCMAICFPASLPYHYFGDRSIVTYFLLWLGVSIGMHAFPSNVDASHILNKAKEEAKKKNIFAILSFPLVIIIYIANILSFFWFDVLYGFFIGIILPGYIMNML